MKLSLISMVFLIPTMSFAQNFQGMSEDDMQNMMQQMQKVGACMQNIDESKMKSLEQRSRKIEAELKSLCNSGKRAQAQEAAMAFGKEMANDPTVKKMTKCGEMMEGAVPGMPAMEEYDDDLNGHVCDGMD